MYRDTAPQKYSSQPRAASRINAKLDKRLLMYVAAAGAAGAGLLARGADAVAIWRREGLLESCGM